MLTTATYTPAHSAPQTRKWRAARPMIVMAGTGSAFGAWTLEVLTLHIHLNYRFGTGHIQTVGVGQIVGGSLAASLLGWLLLVVLERRTRNAAAVWTTIALAGLAASLVVPLAAATTTSAAVGLAVMHVWVAAHVIPFMARTARSRKA